MAGEDVIIVEKDKVTSYLASPTVEVRIGKDGDVRSFHIHKDLLTSRSKFFANALKGHRVTSGSGKDNDIIETIQWKEGLEGMVELPDDQPVVFAAYVQLIYNGNIPIREDVTVPTPPENAKEEDKAKAEKKFTAAVRSAVRHEYRVLSDLYILAEKLQDINAKRSILSAFVDATTIVRANRFQYVPCNPTVGRIYAGTTPSDPIRAFFVDCWVLVGNSGWLSKTASEYPQEFLIDVVSGMLKERAAPKEASRLKDAAEYLDRLNAPTEDDASQI